MVKTTIIGLAALGALGTGGQAVAPQALEVSAGSVTLEITMQGVTSRANETPELGIAWITQGNKRLKIKF